MMISSYDYMTDARYSLKLRKCADFNFFNQFVVIKMKCVDNEKCPAVSPMSAIVLSK